jgi:hypothetical protein
MAKEFQSGRGALVSCRWCLLHSTGLLTQHAFFERHPVSLDQQLVPHGFESGTMQWENMMKCKLGTGRTYLMQGAVLFMLFAAYLFLAFIP